MAAVYVGLCAASMFHMEYLLLTMVLYEHSGILAIMVEANGHTTTALTFLCCYHECTQLLSVLLLGKTCQGFADKVFVFCFFFCCLARTS